LEKFTDQLPEKEKKKAESQLLKWQNLSEKQLILEDKIENK